MVTLIVLNIILIGMLIFLLLYLFFNKKYDDKKSCVDDVEFDKNEKDDYKINSERVFDGRIVTDEEYNKFMKNRRSDISILLEELDNEYERLKELNK